MTAEFFLRYLQQTGGSLRFNPAETARNGKRWSFETEELRTWGFSPMEAVKAHCYCQKSPLPLFIGRQVPFSPEGTVTPTASATLRAYV